MSTTTTSEREALGEKLRSAKSLWIVSHIAPDADTLGSALGLAWSLRPLGIEVHLACADPVPLELRFLPGAELITTHPYAGEEVIVAVDNSDVQRIGSLYNAANFSTVPVLNIDHHVTNTHFGSLNWVEDKPATCEIILELLQTHGIKVGQETATCLLAGIVGDTQCFRTNNTAPSSLAAAAELQSLGAPLFEIANSVLNQRPSSALAVWKEALTQAQSEPGIITTILSHNFLSSVLADDSSTNGLSSWLAGLEGTRIAAVLRETSTGKVDISMRSTPEINVAAVAKALGGGGHPQAAGCVIAGPLPASRNLLLSHLRQLIATNQSPHSPAG
ncbi:MAG: DHH family phosphoesterase [Anaerolineae bacterium]